VEIKVTYPDYESMNKKWYLYLTILKTLGFPSSRFPVWCGKGRKKCELALFFFPSQRVLVSLSFSWLYRALFASRSRARKRKKARAPTSVLSLI
jgi:hypothetical protein